MALNLQVTIIANTWGVSLRAQGSFKLLFNPEYWKYWQTRTTVGIIGIIMIHVVHWFTYQKLFQAFFKVFLDLKLDHIPVLEKNYGILWKHTCSFLSWPHLVNSCHTLAATMVTTPPRIPAMAAVTWGPFRWWMLGHGCDVTMTCLVANLHPSNPSYIPKSTCCTGCSQYPLKLIINM